MARPLRIARALRVAGARQRTCLRSTTNGQKLLVTRLLSSSSLSVLRDVAAIAPTLKTNTAVGLDTIQQAGEILESTASSSRTRVCVYNVESEHEPTSSLVSALLCDPLSSDNEQQSRIRDRWAGGATGEKPLLFKYRPQYGFDPDSRTVHVTSPWLSQRAVSISELPPGSALESDNLAHFLSADIPIVVANPLSGLLDDVLQRLRPVRHPNLIIVVNAAASSRTAEHARRVLAQQVGYSESSAPQIIFANIDQAMHAVDTLRDNPISPSTIKDYQVSTVNSNISSLTDAIDSTINTTTIQESRDQIARCLTICAIETTRESLSPIRVSISTARSLIANLSSQVTNESNAISEQLLGSSTTYESLRAGTSHLRDGDYGTILDLHRKSGAEVQKTLNTLRWWKLPAVADEVQYRMNGAVERAYRGDVERHLVFHAGRLASIQRHFLTLTSSALADLPTQLSSSILQNTLAQLRSAPSFLITPNQLLNPALARLYTLSNSTLRLHKSAHRLVLSTGLSALSSSALSGYLFIASFIEASTAIGVSSLVSLSVLRWAVGRWEHAKRKWMDDWERVGKAVERDVREEARKCLDEKVFVVPMRACDGVEEICKKREDELKNTELVLKGIEERFGNP